MQGSKRLLIIVAALLYSCGAMPVFQTAENFDRIPTIAQMVEDDINPSGHHAFALPIRELEEQDHEEGKNGFIGDLTGIPTLPFKRELEGQDVQETKDGFIGDIYGISPPPFKRERERGGEQDKEMMNGFIGDLTGINSLPFKRNIERAQVAQGDAVGKRTTDSVGLEDVGDYWIPFISRE